MIPAAVGFQCPECVRTNMRTTRQNLGPYGGQISARPRRTSIAIIIINAIVWGVIQIAGLLHFQDRVVYFLGLLPKGMCLSATQSGEFFPHATTQGLCQAVQGGQWVPGVADGAWWQIFTSIFTHVTILHIACNCLTLWFLGPPLEQLLGRTRFIVTYVVAGLVGSLGVYWLSATTTISYGGSGSLFGLMGALLIILWRQKSDIRQLLMWLGLNVIITFVGGGGISWQAHLGGLLGGALLGCIWAFAPAGQNRARTQWALVVVLVVIVFVGLAGRTVMLA